MKGSQGDIGKSTDTQSAQGNHKASETESLLRRMKQIISSTDISQ